MKIHITGAMLNVDDSILLEVDRTKSKYIIEDSEIYDLKYILYVIGYPSYTMASLCNDLTHKGYRCNLYTVSYHSKYYVVFNDTKIYLSLCHFTTKDEDRHTYMKYNLPALYYPGNKYIHYSDNLNIGRVSRMEYDTPFVLDDGYVPIHVYKHSVSNILYFSTIPHRKQENLVYDTWVTKQSLTKLSINAYSSTRDIIIFMNSRDNRKVWKGLEDIRIITQ